MVKSSSTAERRPSLSPEEVRASLDRMRALRKQIDDAPRSSTNSSSGKFMPEAPSATHREVESHREGMKSIFGAAHPLVLVFIASNILILPFLMYSTVAAYWERGQTVFKFHFPWQ